MRTRLFVLIIMAFALVSCTHDRNDPGRAYFPDMAYSNAYESYSANPVFKDGKTMQAPVEGTVPREMIPYPYKRVFEDQQKAAETLVNPMQADKETLEKGKEEFDIFCAVCHGFKGKGDGHLYTAKLFAAKPSDLTASFTQEKPDGEIYHIMTVGSLSGLMGAHGSQISPENRWKIVTYIKNNFKVK
ncbi:MAG: c-type cytochrome [Chlorobi bacterium]|nr:c-type cytochrome [Chlorobiota bacterium]